MERKDVGFTGEYHLQHDDRMWNTGLIVLLGVWMVMAPLVLPDASVPVWNNRLIGLLVVSLALASPKAYGWEVFAAAAVGAWLIGSSFVPALLVNGGLVLNDVVSGVLLIATGARATAQTSERVAPKLP